MAISFGVMGARVLVGMALATGVMAAAQGRTMPELTPMPADVKTVTDRLETLGTLPAGQWRYHAGDLAHGEDPKLDDSGWPVATPPRFDLKTTDSVWLRRWVEIPAKGKGYDVAGAKVTFKADIGGGGTEIVYLNGRRVAMGEDLEPIALFDKAEHGEKVLVAVKVYAGASNKRLNAVRMVVEAGSGRPSPDDLRQGLVGGWALATTLGAGATAAEGKVQQAAKEVDFKALDGGNGAGFEASLKKAEGELDGLKPAMAGLTLHLTGNSHIDAAWLWPWTETVEAVRHTFGTALQLMREYPEYTYTQSAAQYNEWMAQKYPEMDKEIQKGIDAKRWEIVGGMWVEPDLNMPDGESLVRQLLVGKRWFKQHYGVDVRIGWNPDSFGYTWQLPQIYKKSGVDYFVTQKMAWNETNQLPLKLFWWESPDGSKVLAYFPHDYANDNLHPTRLLPDMARARMLNPGTTEIMDLYGIGDHGGGPTRTVLDEGMRLKDSSLPLPKMEFGTAQTYFSNVEQKVETAPAEWNYETLGKGTPTLPAAADGKMMVPTWKDELYFEYHRGVFTSQANHKRNMRESEEQMLNAEKWSSFAWMNGAEYPGAKLNEAWKKVLFNQFHDLGAGSGIGVIYKDAQKDYDMVKFTAGEAQTNALQTLAARVDTRAGSGSGEGVPVMVTNPLAWPRTDYVEMKVQLPESAAEVAVLDGKGKALPSEVESKDDATHEFKLLVRVSDVPSLGYTTLRVVPKAKKYESDLKAEGLKLENAHVSVTVDAKSGCITSLYDKKAKFETIADGGCGNMMQAFVDKPKEYDAWNIDANFEDHVTNLDTADSVELVEHTPLKAVIRVKRHWQSSKFSQDIVLYADTPMVDVVNDFDWRERHVLLKVAFPLRASSGMATYEIPYGTIERPTTRNNSIEKAKFEVPAMRWADLGDGEHGLSVINEAKYGYDAKGNVLRLTMLRSPTYPDAEADQGRQQFRYALYPHAGTWKTAETVHRGYEYNYRLEASQVMPHAGSAPATMSFVGEVPANLVLTAVKKREDGDGMLLRFYEWAGKETTAEVSVPAGVTAATEANMMEVAEGAPLRVGGGKVSFVMKPYEIKTVVLRFGGGRKMGEAF